MVNVRLVEGQECICSDADIYPHVVAPPKLWMQKNLPRFRANVPSLNELIGYGNFTNYLEIWLKDSQDVKP